MPPTVVFSEKVTLALARGPPEESRTWNTTVEVSGCWALPVPLRAMLVTDAVWKTIEPIEAAATVTLPVADRGPPATAVAVITSCPEQPLATYVAFAMPVVVVTGEFTVARP